MRWWGHNIGMVNGVLLKMELPRGEKEASSEVRDDSQVIVVMKNDSRETDYSLWRPLK